LIPVRSVIDGTGRDVSPLIVDRNLETRWVSEKPQAAGDEVVVHLGSPADVERFEIDLATYTLDYPRHLRIAAALSDGTSRVVFEGRTAGLAVLGALANHQATTLEIDLDEAVEATTLILTLLDDDETFHWSIAELRVLGTLSGR
jgi:allantoicase